mmetsp:Transcript_24618/g.82411  ORF Transcript_24618/g.82411 Transcript_24618/m.82411 type:complete len:234 (+) Transcript_24618:1041-1742(+)
MLVARTPIGFYASTLVCPKTAGSWSALATPWPGRLTTTLRAHIERRRGRLSCGGRTCCLIGLLLVQPTPPQVLPRMRRIAWAGVSVVVAAGGRSAVLVASRSLMRGRCRCSLRASALCLAHHCRHRLRSQWSHSHWSSLGAAGCWPCGSSNWSPRCRSTRSASWTTPSITRTLGRSSLVSIPGTRRSRPWSGGRGGRLLRYSALPSEYPFVALVAKPVSGRTRAQPLTLASAS